MKPYLIVLPVLALVVVAVLVMRQRSRSAVSEGGGVSVALQTLEEKLAALATCGITLRPEFSVDDLLSSWGRAQYEEPGFDMTLVGVGMTQEEPPWTPRSDMLWHFDTECIEDHGSYVAIATRLKELAGGSLPLTRIEDYVDLEEGEAWLSFEIGGKTTKIDCQVDDDWVDAAVFAPFVRLLADHDPSKIFLYYNLGGQDCIIGCLDKADYGKLRKLIPGVEPLQ